MIRFPQPLIEYIQALRRTGLSIAEVAGVAGVSKLAVRKYTGGLPVAACGCGRAGGHNGWCTSRTAMRPRRGRAVAAMVERNRKWTPEALEALRADYTGGVEMPAMVASLCRMLGADVTELAVRFQVSALDLRRPPGYRSATTSRAMTAIWAARDRSITIRRRKRKVPVMVAAPKISFSMTAMRGPDPLDGLRRQQSIDAGKGNLNPVVNRAIAALP